VELKKWLFDSSSYDGICIVPLIDVIFFLKLCHMRYQISNATSNISTCSYSWNNHLTNLTILFSPLLGYLPCWSKVTYFTMASTFAWMMFSNKGKLFLIQYYSFSHTLTSSDVTFCCLYRKYQATLMTCLLFDPITKVQVFNYIHISWFEVSQICA